MQLTFYTDYSLRVLIYLGLHRNSVPTIAEIARSYCISRNHIVKVVHNLANLGLVRTIRGRNGGMLLAREPEAINVADVIRETEPNFHLAECFKPSGKCCIAELCRFRIVLDKAFQSFFAVLGHYTLADLIENNGDLVQLLRQVEIPVVNVIQ